MCEVATPRTYERFTRRPRGAVGGVRQTPRQYEPARHSARCGRPRLLAGGRHAPGRPGDRRLLPRQSPGRRGCAGRREPTRRRSRAARVRRPPEEPLHAVRAHADPEVPTLETLGGDLLVTTPYQRRLALARPFLGVAAYALAAYAGLWWLAPLPRLLGLRGRGHRDARRCPRVAGPLAAANGVGPVRHGCRPAGERPRLSSDPPATPPASSPGPTIRRATRRDEPAGGGPVGTAVPAPALVLGLTPAASREAPEAMAGRRGCLGPRRPGRRALAPALDARRAGVRRSGDRRQLGLSAADGPPAAPATTATRRYRRRIPCEGGSSRRCSWS